MSAASPLISVGLILSLMYLVVASGLGSGSTICADVCKNQFQAHNIETSMPTHDMYKEGVQLHSKTQEVDTPHACTENVLIQDADTNNTTRNSFK